MFNITKQQAQQIERLQTNPDFKTYLEIIKNLKSEEEEQVWKNQ